MTAWTCRITRVLTDAPEAVRFGAAGVADGFGFAPGVCAEGVVFEIRFFLAAVAVVAREGVTYFDDAEEERTTIVEAVGTLGSSLGVDGPLPDLIWMERVRRWVCRGSGRCM